MMAKQVMRCDRGDEAGVTKTTTRQLSNVVATATRQTMIDGQQDESY